MYFIKTDEESTKWQMLTLTIERLIAGLAVRRTVCRQIFDGHMDEMVFRALDEMAI